EEELRLVPDDRTADDAAPVAAHRRRLRQSLRSNEVVFRGEGVRRGGREHHALELVGSALGDRVHDRAAGAAELRVVHAGEDLDLLNRLDRRAYLRPRAGAERIVAVVAAVYRDVVALRGLAGGDDGVVAHLVRGRELHAGQERDGGEVVA